MAFAPLPPRRPALSRSWWRAPIRWRSPSWRWPAPSSLPDPRPTKPVNWTEPKAAASALFDSRTASLNLTFAPHLPGDLTMTRFSGPAVKPLPVLRQASL